MALCLISIQKNMNHSDVREDRTMELLLSSLRALGKEGKEVMMVISWLQFHNYLNKISTNSPTAYLPRITPFTGKKKSGGLRQRGRFDILIIHKQYSLISIKVKSLGSDISQTVDTSMIVKCVQEAISQLEKTGNTLKYLVSDVPDVKVISVLALPYITSSQLTQALHSNPEVEKVRETLISCSVLVFNSDIGMKLVLMVLIEKGETTKLLINNLLVILM